MTLIMVVHLVSISATTDGEIMAMSGLVVKKLGRFIDQTSNILEQVLRGRPRRKKLLERVPYEKGKVDTDEGSC